MSITKISTEYWQELLKRDWLDDIDEEEWFITWEWQNIELSDLCNWDCNTCMSTIIDEYKNRLNQVLCCKSHPETWEVNPDTNACPEYNINNWYCNIYNSEDYPEACKNYHCKTHNR